MTSLFRYFILPLFIVIFACSAKEEQTFTEQGWQAAVDMTRTEALYAPNQNENRFFAPWMAMPDKSFLDVAGWKLFTRTAYTQAEKNFLPRVIPDAAGRIARTQGDFILWVGHNTFLIRINGQYWLTDPMFSHRAMVPARKTPPGISLEAVNRLAPAPNIIITHNHYDHLDRASMTQLPWESRVFVPMGLKNYVREMKKPRVTELNWWQQMDLGEGVKLVCLPAQHWSMRLGQGRNTTLWAAWMLITPKATLFFGGDSGYFKGFREIGKKYPDIDFAFMATTAYQPRWFMHYQHMDVPEAVQAFEDLGAKVFIPTQWGTFHLGSNPPGLPGLDLARHIKTNNLDPEQFKILDIGEILKF